MTQVVVRAAAGVLFTDEAGDVLMVTPSYKPHLEIPGGGVESGESPSQAAVRELKEELAIDCRPGRLLVVDWWTEGGGRAPEAQIRFVFDGGVLDAGQRTDVRVDGSEIVGWGFLPPGALDQVAVPRLANRLRHALAARSEPGPRYLENGAALASG